MLMEWQKTPTGSDVLIFDENTYMSFGKDDNIKWIHLSYIDHSGTRCGKMLPITLNKVKGEFSKKIGLKNLTKLRGLIKPQLVGEVLPRKKFALIGETINLDNKSK